MCKPKNILKTTVKLILVIVIFVLILGLSGCFSINRNSLDLGIADSGKEISFSQFGELTVTLESNPSTGFKWIEKPGTRDSMILNLKSHQYVPPEKPDLGSTGTEVWTFEANLAGKTGISLEYKAPYEGAVATAVFNITVDVKEKE